ncbi:centrosomin isoform X1 [Drosophila rhopaloa]|uniref:Centrosomin isoform X1 n=1 Tax=Drosophila rhopaloa TaxID=1041015 RepID=A0A6P4EJ17_DRORH|nr:centrosomin isoform X1 [Drosophila rhopaloa]
MDQSKQVLRDYCGDGNGTCASSLREITLIETVTSFLEENGASEIDRRVLRKLAEALSKSIDDTSPGALQDVTMENSYASFDVPRPQGGSHSPMMMQGRSVRELEEQMSTLRKENFNLKLRIYFMEEGQPGARANNSQDSLGKQLIDSKIQIEMLRKTVDEKMELLKDAARAISHHEEMQRKVDFDSQAIIDDLQEQIRSYQMAESAQPGESNASFDMKKLQRLESEVHKLEDELMETDIRNKAAKSELEFALAERLESLTACEAKIEELAIKNAELVERLEKDTESVESANTKRELGAQLADKMCELQDAQEKLKERERIHEQACRTIQKLMQKLSSQEKEIKRLNQEKEQSVNKGNDSNKTTISPSTTGRSMSDNEASSLEISTNLRVRYELKITEQEEKIKQLQAEVKKKTANLQNLVNKELWEKNREVERLTKLLANQQKTLPQIGEESAGEADLQQSFTEAEYMRAVERNKVLQRKVDVLFQRLAEDQQNFAVIGQLRLELQQARTDVETSDKWRLECADVCSVLTNRLEELAGFLNSLLKHKDVLGVLAADRRHAMRKAVDRSLDLSKSLNMTLNITGASLADQSLAQLCNLSEILYTEGDVSHKTFNSHEEIHAASSMSPTVENLKAENKALKRELEKRRSTEGQQLQRKERRSLPLPSQQLDNQSESEAWSEPDRKVSLARIGLDETSNSLAAPDQPASESESEGRACATRQDRNRNSERIAQLEEQIAQKDERVLNVQCQLVELDNRYKQEQLRCLDISQQLEQLRAINAALTADLQAIGSHEDQRMVEMQRQLELKTQQIDQLKLAQSTLTADAQITEMELQAVQQQMQEMEQQHADSVDHLQTQLEQHKVEAVKQLEEHEHLHQEALERDWVALTTYQEQAQQLLELQRSLDYHQENEKELKQTLVENELATRALKKQLDESTLQASKAVMERTKAYNDKLQLEKRSEELKLQLEALKEEQRKFQQKRSNSSDVSQSGYTSEEVAVPMGPPASLASSSKLTAAAVVAQRVNNSSPDLGIESDAGRISSVELSNAQRAMLKTVELKNECAKTKSEESSSPDSKANLATAAATAHDCAKVDLENAELRRKLIRTKRAFEDTYEKLRMANKAKAQVEKDIKNQILKTHNVLRNVRSNMENEL